MIYSEILRQEIEPQPILKRADGTEIVLQPDDYIIIDDNQYCASVFRRFINHAKSMHLLDDNCPLCGCSLEESGKFYCAECGEVLDLDEMAEENICKDCWRRGDE